jgi:hypothetical protein
MDQQVSFLFTFAAQWQTQSDKLLTPALAEGQHEFHLHSTGFEVPNNVFYLGEILANLDLIRIFREKNGPNSPDFKELLSKFSDKLQ